MSAYRYYHEENMRWRKADRAEALPSEARAAIETLSVQRGVPCPEIRFLPGSGRGTGQRPYQHVDPAKSKPGGRVTLGTRRLRWLLVAHELAHVWSSSLGHDAEHAAETERVLRELAAAGYATREIEMDLRRQAKRTATVERRAARESSRDVRAELIERRREQIARLDRKIKSLATRRRSAQRSLNALLRASALGKGGAP